LSSTDGLEDDGAGTGEAAVIGRKGGFLSTGEMARRTGTTLRTVRFYEEAGLLQPERSYGGHRMFPASELKKLKLVSELRAAGLSLDEIRDLLSIKQRESCGAKAAGRMTALLEAQIDVLSERVAVLTRLVKELQAARQVLGECCGCFQDRRFPHHCGSCHVMDNGSKTSDAVEVLWELKR